MEQEGEQRSEDQNRSRQIQPLHAGIDARPEQIIEGHGPFRGGQPGLDLEAKIGTPAAAMAIYMASDPERWKNERLPDFYCDNATALADMARMAGVTP